MQTIDFEADLWQKRKNKKKEKKYAFAPAMHNHEFLASQPNEEIEKLAWNF